MTDITIRKNNGGQTPAPIAREFDPFRTMRDLLRFDPFQTMSPIWPTNEELVFAPDFEVKEIKDAYLFKADVPGVKESDIEVTLTGNRLTINGERNEEKEEKGETYYSCERKYGSFSRSYTLPEGADAEHIHADLKAGVLTVAVPKLAEVQAKKIPVKSAPAKA